MPNKKYKKEDITFTVPECEPNNTDNDAPDDSSERSEDGMRFAGHTSNFYVDFSPSPKVSKGKGPIPKKKIAII